MVTIPKWKQHVDTNTFLMLFLGLSVFFSCGSTPFEPFIAVNLVGYNSHAQKQAFLVNAEAETFEVVDAATSSVVYRGEVAEPRPPDKSSGDKVSVIDFSEFEQKGEYLIRIPESGIKSQPFQIGQHLYKEVALTTVQSFFYARCGTAIDNGEPWTHSVCHVSDGPFWGEPNRHKDVTGGWHDAGDYNKFSVNTALSAGLLLYLYETRPEVFTDQQLDIPESDNNIPDLLDEVRWALEWMLKMQNQEGGVHHKVSQKHWTGEYLPQNDPETRYIFRVTSNATASFTAVAAMGARLFEAYDSDFADQLSTAAFKGWHYLQEHPAIQPPGGFKNPPEVNGGEYSDDHDEDMRLWAAVELYKLTEDQQFLQQFTRTLEEYDIQYLPPLSWKNVEVLALSAFLNAELPKSYHQQQQQILAQFKGQAYWLMNKSDKNNYGYLLDKDEFYWGSNSVNLAYAFLLIQLYEKTGKEEYYQVALDQLHYTLGRNPLDMSYVTGVGNTSVQHPYHQFSQQLNHENPVPGMLVGGPNNKQDLRGHDLADYPAKSYEDRFKNYIVNEVAINYTAVFAYVAGYFAAAEKGFVTITP